MIKFFIRSYNYAFLFAFILLICGCFENDPKSTVHVIENSEIPNDFYIPQDLIKKVEANVLLDTKILLPTFSYVPLKVLLTEKNSGTLSSSSLMFSFPKGGGTLDLKSAISGQGSFYLSFPNEQFLDLPELEHLYYISLAPQKNIEGEQFGLGCGKWLDLKTQFTNFNKPKFLSLNTTGHRHLYVTAGHYIFVFRKLNQIFLTQLTIKDSKNLSLLCPEIKVVSL